MFDANELLDKVKTENMLLLDKVKNLELELSVTREQTNRTASITVSKTHFTNFASSSEPFVSEIVKPAEVTLSRKMRVDLKESKPKTPNPPKDKVHDRPA